MLHPPSDQFQPQSIVPALQEDALLLALGDKLEAATQVVSALDDLINSEDTEANWDRLAIACDAERQVIRDIEKLTATTLAGLRVKARAISRCHCDEPIEDSFFCLTDDAPATDIRLAAGILRDLLSIPTTAREPAL